MVNQSHLNFLLKDSAEWNQWREKNPTISPDLSEVNLSGMKLQDFDFHNVNLIKANLSMVNFNGTNLCGADLSDAFLSRTDFRKANLSKTNLRLANLSNANLSDAILDEANLQNANLSEANLTNAHLIDADLREADLNKAILNIANLNRANLSKAILSEASLISTNLTEATLNDSYLVNAHLIETNFEKANLNGCLIYGISAWGLKLNNSNQSNLIITSQGEPRITVDNIEIAQFIYLLLYNEKIREVIDTITSKVVLILGRFTPERKSILDAIHEEVRQHDYVPVIFDFETPYNRDITETISILARMSRFIIADITDARSIPQELESIVPHLPSVPVQPLIAASENEYGMFEHFERYPWVLEIYRYEGLDEILSSLKDKVIEPAEKMALEFTSH